MELLNKYKSFLHELQIIRGVEALLSWDQETKMPTKNTMFRAEQESYISSLAHKKYTSKEFVRIVNELFDQKDSLEAIWKRSVEFTKRNLDKHIKLPIEFVEEFSKTTSLAHEAWLHAKKTEDFEKFKPLLQRIIDLTIQKADYIDNSKSIYDVLLDDYEEGMTTQKLDKVFDQLKMDLVEIIKKSKRSQIAGAHNHIVFEEHKVEEFIITIIEKIGFDLSKGAVGRVHHPFETSLSPNDVRINMSYYHKNFLYTVTGAIHELGHGLYEQNVDEKYHSTDLAQGVSLGIHESQSRLLENMIGRSSAFWKYALQELDKFLQIKNTTTEKLHEKILNDLNRVEPSLIRIEADEVTYNLHIILRYEVEQALLNKTIILDELPELWNSKMHELLGIKPQKISQGCLQDVHWSLGSFGYFPTYSLGNIIAGQLWNKFTESNSNVYSQIALGNFSQYYNWFKDKIWQHGSYYNPSELLMKVTGQEMDSNYLVTYLKEKYLK